LEIKFRKLKEDEIDVRVAQINEKGASLLLYKDARVDQNILDETVGPLNWQRRHTRDNANCIVSIWDEEKKQWIEKEDTGTESNTEKEKGLASDSFKRACFNWGIGRELYTAPFIWVPAEKAGVERRSDGKYHTRYTFYIEKIAYDDLGNISELLIKNQYDEPVFTWDKSKIKRGSKSTPKQPEEVEQYVCFDCGKPFESVTFKGKKLSAKEAYEMSMQQCKDGKARCRSCRTKLKEKDNNA